MSDTHKNKPLERIRALLDFIKRAVELHPNKETFYATLGELADFNVLLSDADLLKTAFAKIADSTNEKVLIEFRQTPARSDTATGERMSELTVWFYVESIARLNQYRNEIQKKLEKEISACIFILDSEGYFYFEGASDKLKHRFKQNSLRYRLLRLLAQRKSYVPTQELADELEVRTGDIRGAVEEIRTLVFKKMGLPREGIFENNADGTGYKVANVTIKEL